MTISERNEQKISAHVIQFSQIFFFSDTSGPDVNKTRDFHKFTCSWIQNTKICTTCETGKHCSVSTLSDTKYNFDKNNTWTHQHKITVHVDVEIHKSRYPLNNAVCIATKTHEDIRLWKVFQDFIKTCWQGGAYPVPMTCSRTHTLSIAFRVRCAVEQATSWIMGGNHPPPPKFVRKQTADLFFSFENWSKLDESASQPTSASLEHYHLPKQDGGDQSKRPVLIEGPFVILFSPCKTRSRALNANPRVSFNFRANFHVLVLCVFMTSKTTAFCKPEYFCSLIWEHLSTAGESSSGNRREQRKQAKKRRVALAVMDPWETRPGPVFCGNPGRLRGPHLPRSSREKTCELWHMEGKRHLELACLPQLWHWNSTQPSPLGIKVTSMKLRRSWPFIILSFQPRFQWKDYFPRSTSLKKTFLGVSTRKVKSSLQTSLMPSLFAVCSINVLFVLFPAWNAVWENNPFLWHKMQ